MKSVSPCSGYSSRTGHTSLDGSSSEKCTLLRRADGCVGSRSSMDKEEEGFFLDSTASSSSDLSVTFCTVMPLSWMALSTLSSAAFLFFSSAAARL